MISLNLRQKKSVSSQRIKVFENRHSKVSVGTSHVKGLFLSMLKTQNIYKAPFTDLIEGHWMGKAIKG